MLELDPWHGSSFGITCKGNCIDSFSFLNEFFNAGLLAHGSTSWIKHTGWDDKTKLYTRLLIYSFTE